MKWFLIGGAMFILCLSFTIFQNEYDRHHLEAEHVKFTAQEAAAAAAQYFVDTEYAEGRYVFNQAQGILAAEHIIKNDLELNDKFEPLPGSYWTEKVTYTIEFFDDKTITNMGTCTGYPCLYTHPTTDFVLTITQPTVIVTIYAGKARYTTLGLFEQPQVYRTGAHEWKSYAMF